MKVSVDEETWTEPRFLRLCQALQCGRTSGVGTLVILWHATRARNFVCGTRAQLLHCLPWPAQPQLLEALIAQCYVLAHPDGMVEVVGNAEVARIRQKRADAGRKGFAAFAETMAKRKEKRAARKKAREDKLKLAGKPLPPPPKRRRPAADKAAETKPVRVKLEAPTTSAMTARRLAWEAYSAEYQARWGVVPLRNARTNALVAQFVLRVGQDLSPQVMRFFVRHNDREYLRATHGLNLAVRDAEGLATQFQRDTPITHRDIARFEEAQAPGDQLARIARGEL